VFAEPSPSNDGGYCGGHTQQGDLISLLLFFQNKESGLKSRNLRQGSRPPGKDLKPQPPGIATRPVCGTKMRLPTVVYCEYVGLLIITYMCEFVRHTSHGHPPVCARACLRKKLL
jgi:hypothetical protein